MSSCAILFVKHPVPGQVKTRLQPRLGAAAAARLYRAFVLDSAETLAAVRADRRVVAFAPASAREETARLLSGAGTFEYVPQPEGGLGMRLEEMMWAGFACGADRVVIIGSDSPSLPAEAVEDALELLRTKALVLGPSIDGGYYLVGQSRPCGGIFRGIAWSTGAVLGQTLAALPPGAELGLLPPHYDVDTPAAAAFLRVHLEALHRAGEHRGHHSLEVLRGLDLPLPS